MVLLIRIVLISLIIYLLIRSFLHYGNDRKNSGVDHEKMKKDSVPGKKISGNVGDYIDFEEVDRNKQ
jgi:hypothetical protein